MRKLAYLLILLTCVSGCKIAAPASGDALCDGSRVLRDRHAAALSLLDDAEPRQAAAIISGGQLIFKLDAGCR